MFIRGIVLLALMLIPAEASATGYVVRPGDTLGSIAQRNHVTVASLAAANGLSNPNLIQVGRVLVIPGGATTTTSYGPRYYKVQWGDTLIGLGVRYGMSVPTIRSLNPQVGTYLIAGQWIRLCSTCQATTSTSTPSAAEVNVYVVRPGDSLSAIAAHYGISVSALVSVNRLENPNFVRIGAHISIPSGGSAAAAPAATSSTYDPWSARSLIATYADYYGVSRALAYAIGWQESGFNQTLVSSTGAVGVMQVEPYTGDEIARQLGRTVNLYNTRDNVQAGVYWLYQLLRYYGWNTRMAVAAYYQGTDSIARHGFYADTTQYVNNVLTLMVRFGG